MEAKSSPAEPQEAGCVPGKAASVNAGLLTTPVTSLDLKEGVGSTGHVQVRMGIFVYSCRPGRSHNSSASECLQRYAEVHSLDRKRTDKQGM